MGHFTKKVKGKLLAGLYVVSFLLAPLIIAPKAFAFGFVSFGSKPEIFSGVRVATFEFSAFPGSTECKLDGASFTACVSPYVTPSLVDGSHTFVVHVVGESNPQATASYTWTVNPLPVFSGGSDTSGEENSAIAVSDLQIDDTGNDSLTIQLSVPSGVLTMSTVTGLTFNGAQSGSSLEFSGTKGSLNSALATLSYTPSSTGVKTITAKISGQDGDIYNMIGGHAYKVIKPLSALSWSAAKTAAEASTYGGATGYLANVENLTENTFINTRLQDTSWFGASDTAVEGDWRWTGGPENNTAFWSGDASGSAVGGAYNNWRGGMPDNYNGVENCGELEQGLATSTWNDQDCSATRSYYVVEYGNSSTTPYLAMEQIDVTSNSQDVDGDGLNNLVEVAAPNSGDANADGVADRTQANVSSQPGVAGASKYVVVQTSCSANLNFQIGLESSSDKDDLFDYPEGLAGFVGTTCGAPGSTIAVTQYYYGVTDPGKYVLRKWNTTTHTYETISSAVLSSVTIGGQQALKVVYNVVDGGPLDDDLAADGNINDPVGLGLSTIGAPDTGMLPISVSSNYLYIIGGIALISALSFKAKRRIN